MRTHTPAETSTTLNRVQQAQSEHGSANLHGYLPPVSTLKPGVNGKIDASGPAMASTPTAADVQYMGMLSQSRQPPVLKLLPLFCLNLRDVTRTMPCHQVQRMICSGIQFEGHLLQFIPFLVPLAENKLQVALNSGLSQASCWILKNAMEILEIQLAAIVPFPVVAHVAIDIQAQRRHPRL